MPRALEEVGIYISQFVDALSSACGTSNLATVAHVTSTRMRVSRRVCNIHAPSIFS